MSNDTEAAGKSHVVGIRFPTELLAQIDEYAREAAKRAGVERISRIQAVISLVETGLKEKTRRK